MDKASFINDLFIELKDKIEFDEDVLAIKNILISLLKINISSSRKKWLYLMQKYNIKSLSNDIDFEPLIVDYLKCYLTETTLTEFLNLISLVPNSNKSLIENLCINQFSQANFLYSYFQNLIFNEEQEKELSDINLLIAKYINNKLIFNETTFLKNIISIHIKLKKIDLTYIFKLCQIPKSKKSQTLLKSLLIEYI